MTDEEINEKIKRALILYLREECGITTENAYLGSEVEVHRERVGYCDTCGYTEVTTAFDILYSDPKSEYDRALEIKSNVMDFFPVLYGYMERV